MGRFLGLPDRHGVAAAAATTGGAYEFDQLQNHTFSDLAKAMRFVGVFTVFVGAVYGVGALFAIMNGHAVGMIVAVVQCIVDLVLGGYLIQAAANCRRIVETQGSDIPNLMAGLDQLRRYFALQMVLIIVLLVTLAVGLVILLL